MKTDKLQIELERHSKVMFEKGKQETLKDVLEIVDECSNIKCGFMDGLCDRIDKNKFKQRLKEELAK